MFVIETVDVHVDDVFADRERRVSAGCKRRSPRGVTCGPSTTSTWVTAVLGCAPDTDIVTTATACEQTQPSHWSTGALVLG